VIAAVRRDERLAAAVFGDGASSAPRIVFVPDKLLNVVPAGRS